MTKLKIEYVPLEELKTYENNAKIHTAEQIEQIKKSINEFGMNDPIAVWKDNVIIEGHGRLIACREIGLSEVPVIRLDELTDEQRRAYALVHNQVTLNSGFDLDILSMELENISSYDMSDYGFINEFDDDVIDDLPDVSKYSKNAKIPQYEPTGEIVELSDCIDEFKKNELIEEIKENLDNNRITKEEADFLVESAHRHSVFNYRNIAEYYANATPEMQRLMEKSALVIIDFEDAVANGYVKLSQTIQDIIDEEEDDA